MKKIFMLALLGMLFITSCNDLDISPKNIVTDEDLMTNESGMEIYLARMYSYMPFEEFKYMPQWGLRFDSWLGAMGISGTGEALNRDGICSAFTGEDTPYWNDEGKKAQPFKLLRDANYLLETLPKYREAFTEKRYNHYLGEAYFVRATVFYAMARRFGGVPLVTKVIPYPAESSELEVPRSTEEETWDQVLADFDKAAELLETTSPRTGYSNKYVALAFKSEAMLYAGSVAKYNETLPGRMTGLGEKTGVRVIGFASDTWQAASKRYFTEAYKAAREVMETGGYSLYKKKWSATDKEAQYQNMVDMFSDLSSPENIYVKQYQYPTLTHGYDAYSAPFIFRAPLASGTCPTLDFLELFDGFDRYPNGTVKVTTGSSNTTGDYIMYDKPMDFFKNAEPRLRAYVIFPGDMFKGKEIEIRAGIYTGSSPVKPLFNDYSYNSADIRYQHLDAYKNTPKTLFLSPRDGNSQEIVSYNGKDMTAAGANGPFYDFGEGCLTGLYGRKWLNPDPSFEAGEGKSAQPFILMRYAEVLLNAAEAGVELSLAGAPSPDGSNLIQVATEAVNAIRERAGATQLTSQITSNRTGLDIVRKERRKELAFEHKTIWDLRRWRVSHYEGRDEFWGESRDKSLYSNNARYRFRGLYPFFSTQTGKYFFDARFQWVSLKTFEFNAIDYYFAIPSGEVAKSRVIDQQPNR
ncbi:RagB/SusD family nutrient uptake outer membrane protein [Dysgonomonas capnocytophagoides]|uniref:RagB/SusD family nutrient uptake outer membrane protein n=1 Tax=Dysgonomonas capnocytophagoides TaxID=45254 RepID=A0A4Y8L1D1_9BACT|nr:RagB/SusD family nutrient uptake outer membrane protein [Dysgonomonas capnocytophagoides]TFD96495.1 RagB/SusD family nutrient uptake outer membrane protein [Dysgonomonas capnocytophagoides]